MRYLVGLGLMACFAAQCTMAGDARMATTNIQLMAPAVAAFEGTVGNRDMYGELASRDPLAVFQVGLDRYENSVRDYTATFTRREKIKGKLLPEQEMHIKFKDEPFSLLMDFVRNPGKARRVLYVQGRDVDKEGRDLFWVQPESPLARLLVRSLKLPVDCKDARANSNRTLNQFGFENTLELIVKISELADERHDLNMRYLGPGAIDGRPTYQFERTLPFTTEEKSVYPERKLVVHLDQQWLLPVASYCYGDDAKQELIGSFVFSNVKLNTGLSDKDFAASVNGM